jgi:hypothetical protein
MPATVRARGGAHEQVSVSRSLSSARSAEGVSLHVLGPVRQSVTCSLRSRVGAAAAVEIAVLHEDGQLGASTDAGTALLDAVLRMHDEGVRARAAQRSDALRPGAPPSRWLGGRAGAKGPVAADVREQPAPGRARHSATHGTQTLASAYCIGGALPSKVRPSSRPPAPPPCGLFDVHAAHTGPCRHETERVRSTPHPPFNRVGGGYTDQRAVMQSAAGAGGRRQERRGIGPRAASSTRRAPPSTLEEQTIGGQSTRAVSPSSSSAGAGLRDAELAHFLHVFSTELAANLRTATANIVAKVVDARVEGDSKAAEGAELVAPTLALLRGLRALDKVRTAGPPTALPPVPAPSRHEDTPPLPRGGLQKTVRLHATVNVVRRDEVQLPYRLSAASSPLPSRSSDGSEGGATARASWLQGTVLEAFLNESAGADGGGHVT